MWKYRGQQRPPFAEACGAGQESVWDYPRPPRIELDPRRVWVQVGDRIVADSTQSLRVLETASPPSFYFPPADVRHELLEPCPGQSMCEWKGMARYWRVVRAGGASLPDAWSYPSPAPGFQALAEYFSFYPGRVACFVDEERVEPQPGEFYGGWVTREIVGPFKGAQGTSHW